MNSSNEPQPTTNQQDLFPDALEQLSVRNVGALAVFRSYADTLDLVDFINQLTPTTMDVSAGHVVLAMILDTLSGRSPLYRLASSYAGRDIPALLGIDMPPDALNDDLVGRVAKRSILNSLSR